MATMNLFRRKRRLTYLLCLTLAGQTTFSGCFPKERKLTYFGDAHLQYYKDVATEIAYPVINEPTPETVAFSEPPRTLRDRIETDEIWDMTLAEALHLALANNEIIRIHDFGTQLGAYPLAGSQIMANPEGAPSIYDPAIQETGVLFGNRGVEAALAAFDTQFTSSMVWGRSEQIQNNLFFGGGLNPGSTLYAETANFNAALTKPLANGATFSLSHGVNYQLNNVPSNLFGSAYTNNVRADFRQPLWQGAGVEFTRIAGPIGQTFQGISGVNQGVTIARINGDITVAEFEQNTLNMVFDTERVYWDLYFAYRQYDAAVANRNSALRTWREVKAKFDIGARGGGAADEAQARETYFQRRADAEAALNNVEKLEVALRRMCGLPVSDGRIIRPIDEPVTAELVPDWYSSIAEALTRNVRLRQQRWRIKSLDLQLTAAHSLTNPRFDLVASYQVNGFGDKLLAYNDDDGITTQGLNSAYGTLVQGDQTGWTSGFEFSMPIGFRSAHTQVRNLELRLARARQVLAAQEEELSYELARAFQDLALHHTQAKTNFNRRRAAERQVQAFEAEYRAGTQTLDRYLAAQARLAEADTAYYSSLVEYTKTIAFINQRKGTLLEMNNIHVAESQWSPEAYRQALRRAWARSYAFDNPLLHHEPAAFEADVPVDTPELAVPQISPVADPTVPPFAPPAAPGVDVPAPATAPRPQDEVYPPPAPAAE